MTDTLVLKRRSRAPADAAPQPSPPQADRRALAEPDLLGRVFDRIVSRSEAVKAALLAHPEIRAEARINPDLLELIVVYVLAEVASLKPEVQAEFAGEEVYIARRNAVDRERLAADVLALFNGRNASEIARRLRIGRATVYRILKQPARDSGMT